MAPHVFVDESKERRYYLAAVVVPATDLALSRQAIGALVMPRQRRIHFSSESDPRRNKILDTIIDLGLTATIYDAGRPADERSARRACLSRLVVDLAEMRAERLVLELDEAAVKADKELLYAAVRSVRAVDTLRYDHLRAREECLLAVPDAIAWSWARGGAWRLKVEAIVTALRQV